MSKSKKKQSAALRSFYDDFSDYHARSAFVFEAVGSLALQTDCLDPDTASGIVLTAEKLKSETAELRQQLRQIVHS